MNGVLGIFVHMYMLAELDQYHIFRSKWYFLTFYFTLGPELTYHVKKVEVQVYSLISRLISYHPISHFMPCFLDLVIRVSCVTSTPHTHIPISVLSGTHFYLSQVEHLSVKCFVEGHTIETMSQYWIGRNIKFISKSCTKRDSKPHSRQLH